MKRLLWPDSLRIRLIVLSLGCLVLFQLVNGATFFLNQRQQWEQRAAWLARQTAEWYFFLRGAEEIRQRHVLSQLERMYLRAEWRLKFTLESEGPRKDFVAGGEAPLRAAREAFASAFEEEGLTMPVMQAGYIRREGRPALLFAVRLDNGRWLCVTRLGTAQDRREWMLRGVFLAEFFLFFALMFSVLFRATRQLERLRIGIERFEAGLEAAEALPEDGCLEIREVCFSFNRMRERILDSIEERDRMLSALRHDLRTPLARAQLWAEEAEPEYVRRKLLENVRQIQEMVTQSIELAGSLRSKEEVVALDLDAFVESVVDDYIEEGKPVARADTAVRSVIVHTRPLCLRRCLSNLIENSLKYAGGAGVEVVRAGDGARILVSDSGPGIPEDMMEKVFEPWFRVESSRNRETGGAGLGLTIAGNMAALSGAGLTLRNRENGGLQAVIFFPEQLCC